MTQRAAGQPKYLTIAADLRARIESGEYPAGSQLPTHAVLMKRYDVALNTAREALGELRKLGLAETFQGSGTFVRTPPEQPPAPAHAELAQQVAGLRAEMAEALGRIEGNLVELYGKTGNEYPWDERPAQEEGGRSEQRA